MPPNVVPACPVSQKHHFKAFWDVAEVELVIRIYHTSIYEKVLADSSQYLGKHGQIQVLEGVI